MCIRDSLKPDQVADVLRKVAGAVGFPGARYKNIIAGQPEQMPGGFVKLEAFEQKNDFHAVGMDVRSERLFRFFRCLDAKGAKPRKLCLLYTSRCV